MTDIKPTIADIFKDPLSELTRKRQNYLLISAVLTLLIVKRIIAIVEIEQMGLKSSFTVDNPNIVGYFMGAITVYFLFIYIFWFLQDFLKYTYYEKGRGLAVLADRTGKSLDGMVHLGKLQTQQEVDPEIQNIREEVDHALKPLWEKMKEPGSHSEIRNEIIRIRQEAIEKERSVLENRMIRMRVYNKNLSSDRMLYTWSRLISYTRLVIDFLLPNGVAIWAIIAIFGIPGILPNIEQPSEKSYTLEAEDGGIFWNLYLYNDTNGTQSYLGKVKSLRAGLQTSGYIADLKEISHHTEHALFQSTPYFDVGDYCFVVYADKFQLLIDGIDILSVWDDTSSAPFIVYKTITLGQHDIKVHFYKSHLGGLTFRWYQADDSACLESK